MGEAADIEVRPPVSGSDGASPYQLANKISNGFEVASLIACRTGPERFANTFRLTVLPVALVEFFSSL
jgi:hypothetical protein